MTTKLTLTINDKVIDAAKKYATKKGRSLSNVVEGYLKTLVEDDKEIEISAKVKKMIGSIALPKNFDYKKELKSSLLKKYS